MLTRGLVADTRPGPEQYTGAVEAFWGSSLQRAMLAQFDVGENQAGIGFLATFRLLRGRLQLCLTPERRQPNKEGKRVRVEQFTHLRRMYWLDAAWTQRARTREARAFTAELLAAA